MKSHFLGSLLAAVAVFTMQSGLLRAEPDEPAAEQLQRPDAAHPNEAAQPNEAPPRGERVEYWIGVQCSPLGDPALRAQLGLEHHEGIIVDDLLDDGPAAKAGLKRFDVLVSAGGNRLHNVHDLQQAVSAAQGAELKVELYRGGHLQTLSIKPAERPRGPGEPQTVMPDRDRDALRQWLDSLRSGEPRMPPPPLHFFGPGIVMVPERAELPDDMSVLIARKGKQPAKIIVKQGDRTWEATEDKLSELPAEVRAEVEKLLPPGYDFRSQGAIPAMPGAGLPPGATMPGPAVPSPEVARQLEQLRKRLDRLERRQEGGDAPSEHNR